MNVEGKRARLQVVAAGIAEGVGPAVAGIRQRVVTVDEDAGALLGGEAILVDPGTPAAHMPATIALLSARRTVRCARLTHANCGDRSIRQCGHCAAARVG